MIESVSCADALRTGYLIQGLLLMHLLILPERSLATAPPELRLFHEPNHIVEVDSQLIHAISMQSKSSVQAIVKKKPVQAESHNGEGESKVEPVDKAVYQYTGFISTASAQHYFINGVPLVKINSLEFIGVQRGGRLLQLKTRNGPTFELLIGQSIHINAL